MNVIEKKAENNMMVDFSSWNVFCSLLGLGAMFFLLRFLLFGSTNHKSEKKEKINRLRNSSQRRGRR
ncbi:hypothetical protein [Bacillus thuringiensis]|uniref:hypothetical protein n=1 Tax=Bacillus thuringiensis TaxID=1428 RepID=UPI001298B9E5|nr:hypothetical protein [Bacillus thuringiensis]